MTRQDKAEEDQILLSTQRRVDSRQRSILGGIVVRKEVWTLSPLGIFAAAAIIGTIVTLVVPRIYPFLATTQRVDTNVLVVEGWLHPFGIEASAREFKRGSYQRIFTTGGPIVGNGGYVNDFQTSANVGADRLKAAGIAPALVQMVPSRVTDRDRTFASAAALRDWTRSHNVALGSFNIVTEGTHGRRTRLMFERAFGPNVKIGVISVVPPDFNVESWWRYSEGMEEVFQESVEYLYARFLFRTPADDGTAAGESAKN